MIGNLHSREQGLIAAIVKQAVDDLSCGDEQAVFEANEFFLQQSGGWAQWRRLYFGLLGLDEDAVLQRLKPLLTTPERPEKKWTSEEVYEILPHCTFKTKDISNRISISYTNTCARIQHLMDQGKVMRVDRGVFVRDDYYDEWVDGMIAIQPKPAPEPPKTILDALRDGPKTLRQLGFAFDGDIGQNALRQRLIRAVNAGRVEKVGPTYRLAA